MILPSTLHIEFQAAAQSPVMRAWLRANKRAIQRVAARALLGALLDQGFRLPRAPTAPRAETQHERAHRFVWSELASDLGMVIAHGAIPLVRSADPTAFIDLVQDKALQSAQKRSTAQEPTIEAAYTLLLAWLGEYDAAFTNAQYEASQRAEREIARIAQIRTSTPQARTTESRPARKTKGAPREPTPTGLFSDRLRAALHARTGSVLDLGVQTLGDNRFKSYESVLERAWRDVGGTDAALFDHRRRNDVEVIAEQGGFPSGRGGAKRAAILEYVIHPFDVTP